MSNYDEWLMRAMNDLQDIRNNLASQVFPGDTVTFHAHQAIEKALKAFCLFQGTDPGKAHDLVRLLTLASNWKPSLAAYFPTCQALDAVYVASRYPGAPAPSVNDAKHFAGQAEIITAIRALLP